MTNHLILLHTGYLMENFKSLGLPTFLNESLERMNISVPTPIQAESIPPALEGRDILASAQTGTGKTLAYLLPMLANLQKDLEATALILAPTRELAAQIQEQARILLHHNMAVALLIGGDPMHKQISVLKRHPRIIVGTPGRIIDHLQRGTLRLSNAKFLVLDETDRMLDMGFSEDLKKIVHLLPKERQTFMFSATMPPSIKTLGLTYLTNPKQIAVGSTTEPTLKIKQESLQTSANEKFPCLIKELNTREGSVIIFVKTKHGADRLAEKLSRQNHYADAIHGDLKQRKRDSVIRDFRNLKKRIMVATDVAARGLDIPHIMHVINYDLPQCPEDYIHRIGRTGRAGMEGFALSLVSPDENHKWRRIHNLITLGQSDTSPTSSGRSSSGRSGSSGRPKREGERRRPFQKAEGESKYASSRKGPFKPKEGRRGDFKKSEGDFKRSDGDFKKSDRDFKRSEFKKPDGEFKRPEGEFKKRGFKKPDGDFKRSEFKKPGIESEFKKSDGDFKKRDFKKSDGDFKRGDFKKKAFKGSPKPGSSRPGASRPGASRPGFSKPGSQRSGAGQRQQSFR